MSAQALLTKLHDVHPGSMPNTFTGTEDGSILYLGEGAHIAVVDLTNVPPATAPLLMPPAVKSFQVGDLAVLPADLLLDPGLCFTIDADQDGEEKNDPCDLLLVAGGHMGLWAVSADPTPGNPNRALRIDDQQDLAQPLSKQDSVRFCNQLAVVTVGPKRLLAATFAAKGDSRLRLYDLDLIHWKFANGAPEIGSELAPLAEIVLGERVLVPASVSPQTAGASYALGIAVDQDQDVVPADEGADVYLAMNVHGLLRVRLDPVLVPGSNPPQLASIQSTLSWGPVFGTGTPYATPGSGASGPYDPARYENLHLYTVTRSVHYDELARFDPPAFVDTVVQDDGGGHFLYAAVDHLNWVRFDLTQAWSDHLVIDHHEGAEQLVDPEIRWSGQLQVSSWTGRKHIKPTRLDPTDPEEQTWLYARRLSLVDPPLGCGTAGPILVVTHGALPWAQLSDVVAPRPTYGHDFDAVGGVTLGVGAIISNKRVATVFYDVGQLFQHFPGAVGSELGHIEAGGGALWVPPVQSRSGGVNTLLVLHDSVSYVHSVLPMDADGVCLSHFDFLPAGQVGAPTKFYQRNETELLGRYTFSIGWSEADPRVLFLGANDNGEMFHDGALWTRLDGNGEWVIERTGYNPTLPSGDRRMVLGLRPQEDCEWSGDPQLNQAWFVGRAEQPPPTPGLKPTIRWGLFDARITPSATPLVSVPNIWFINYAADRWGRTGRPGGYDVATTSSEAYGAWVQAQHPGAGVENLVLYSRAGTPDNVVVVDREELIARITPFPSGAGINIRDWEPDWEVTRLNCHPEYDPMPNDRLDGTPPAPTPEYTRSQAWWNVAEPPLTDQANSLAWHADTIHFPDRGPGKPERWLLGVPCHFLTHAPALAAQALTRNTALDADFAAWFDVQAPGFPAETAALIQNYAHGLVQFWEISDPDTIATQPTGAGGPQPFGYPEGSSTLPKIVFDQPGSAAYDIEAVKVTTSAGPRVLLVCTDFGGEVLVYDITDLPEGTAPGAPVARWAAPERDLDNLRYFAPGDLNNPRPRQVNVLWSVTVDAPVGDQVRMYAATHEFGIFALTLRDDPSVPGVNFMFDPASTVRIETAGTPFRVRIRPAGAHGPKALLVTDAMGGLRIYGEAGQ